MCMLLLAAGAAYAAPSNATAGDAVSTDQKPEPRPKKAKGDKAGKEKKRFNFKDCDTNNDGVISLEEYLACSPRGDKDKFAGMDADKDGKLTREELKAWRDSKKEEFDKKRREHRRELFKKCDTNKDGMLSMEEFEQCFPKPPADGKKKERRPGKPVPQKVEPVNS